MKFSLDYLNGHLCILNESEQGASSPGGTLGSIREVARGSRSRRG